MRPHPAVHPHALASYKEVPPTHTGVINQTEPLKRSLDMIPIIFLSWN